MTTRTRKANTIADQIAALVLEYETLPDKERFDFDRALLQALDVSPKDWLLAMKQLAGSAGR